MASKDIFAQIRTAYTGDTPLSAALDELYYKKVPDGANPSLPYGTYHFITSSGAIMASGTIKKNSLIQFNIFDDNNDASDLWDARDLLVGVYHKLNVQVNSSAYYLIWNGDTDFEVNGVEQISSQFRVLDHPA